MLDAFTRESLREVIANDDYAATFQSLGQYRKAILKHIDNLGAAARALRKYGSTTMTNQIHRQISSDDAHMFAQALIAAGWHNDNLNCVDTLQRLLGVFLVAQTDASPDTPFVSVFNPVADQIFSCPSCCAKKGEPHTSDCQAPVDPQRNDAMNNTVPQARSAIAAALEDSKATSSSTSASGAVSQLTFPSGSQMHAWLEVLSEQAVAAKADDGKILRDLADFLMHGIDCRPRPHADDIAVDAFAAAMKSKMAKQRAKGYGGWEKIAAVTDKSLADRLMEHTKKGDPVDVANFAMMLHQRNLDQIECAVGTLRGASMDFAKRVASMWVVTANVESILTWQQRMPAPRAAFQCAMNCSDAGMGRVLEKDCGDCMAIKVFGDPVAARDAEIADLRDARFKADSGSAQPASKPTDLSTRLRAVADDHNGHVFVSMRKLDILAAADEIERYYGGMLAWKQTAAACTCPTGDGSLAWPCPVHPQPTPFAQAAQHLQDRDAARYRWMRSLDNLKASELVNRLWDDKLDAAIDEAMQARPAANGAGDLKGGA